MSRRPPSSPLFPYTTLFRSWQGRDLHGAAAARCCGCTINASDRRPIMMEHHHHGHHHHDHAARPTTHGTAFAIRSEEHTSELQSLRHLVCRLLLEKKNKQKE